jgi:DNA polymerase-3 subunit gamma/tau
MTYTVLARKYRPQTFDDLVGQEHVARTIGNAITSGRVAHAFLFTGVRGVGKTTTARLLAKALCCEKGPTPTPCNECATCRDITVGVDMDVLEIDGASNNSVDDVRRLQETLPFQPSRNRFRVIIVDEVHMLSTGAFNAFLKTLEEPPSHVKFIFATTESHKVPITIRSRCQRYDFRLIPQATVAARVRTILAAEKIIADDAAVQLVAREAAGSMRDALTLLDQTVALSGANLVGAELSKSLGIADREAVQRAAAALLSGDAKAALLLSSEIATQGTDVLHFSKQLLGYVRDLTVLQVTAGEPGDLLDLVDEELAAANALAKGAEIAELERTFVSVSQLVDEVARSSMPRTALEMGLVRIASRPRLENLAALVAKLESLGAAGATGGGPGHGGGGGASGRGPSRPAQGASSGSSSAGYTAAPAMAAAPVTSSGNVAAPAAPKPVVAPTPAPTAAAAAAAAATAAPAAAPATSPTPSSAGSAIGLSGGDAWAKIVADIRDHKPAFGAVLEHAVPVEAGPDRLVLSFAEGTFYGRQANTPEAQAILGTSAERCLGKAPVVEIRFHREPPPALKSVADIEKARVDEAREETRRRAMNHPRVIEALQVFPEAAGNVTIQTDSEKTRGDA